MSSERLLTDQRATGIILRTRLLTETSLIVHWLTSDQGRLVTVAKGARRPKSSFAGRIDLYYSADFAFRRSLRSDLHALYEMKLLVVRERLRTDYHALTQAAYTAALIEEMTETETPIPEIYLLFEGFLDALALHPIRPRLVYAFELKLFSELGLDPEAETEDLDSGTRTLMESLSIQPWEALNSITASPSEIRSLHQFLFRFVSRHCPRVPKGRADALTIS
jgi:DNA repair protein RecO (recombination protein O)